MLNFFILTPSVLTFVTCLFHCGVFEFVVESFNSVETVHLSFENSDFFFCNRITFNFQKVISDSMVMYSWLLWPLFRHMRKELHLCHCGSTYSC